MVSRVVLTCGALVLVLGGCGGSPVAPPAGTVVEVSDDGYAGALVDPGYPHALGDLHGHVRAAWTFAKGATRPVTLVFFGYTSCPDVCSAQLADLVAALRGSTRASGSRTQVVWITVDPERDTPSVIRTYLDRFDPTIIGLAPRCRLEEAAAQVGCCPHRSSRRCSGLGRL